MTTVLAVGWSGVGETLKEEEEQSYRVQPTPYGPLTTPFPHSASKVYHCVREMPIPEK